MLMESRRMISQCIRKKCEIASIVRHSSTSRAYIKGDNKCIIIIERYKVTANQLTHWNYFKHVTCVFVHTVRDGFWCISGLLMEVCDYFRAELTARCI